MLKSETDVTNETLLAEQKQMALRYILDAWEEAVYDGVEPDLLVRAAMFAALSGMVATFGEDAVAKLTDGLSERILHGEFTVNRITQ